MILAVSEKKSEGKRKSDVTAMFKEPKSVFTKSLGFLGAFFPPPHWKFAFLKHLNTRLVTALSI